MKESINENKGVKNKIQNKWAQIIVTDSNMT